MDLRPLILTLRIDAGTQAWFDDLRQKHFPPERNFLSAHLTLFHALPAQMLEDAKQRIKTATDRAAFPFQVAALRSLGRGVAFVVESRELDALHAEMVRTWEKHLTPQDRQRFRAHVTIQNKVDPEVARALLKHLQRDFSPRLGWATGLDLWRYAGGPWEAEGGATFGDAVT